MRLTLDNIEQIDHDTVRAKYLLHIHFGEPAKITVNWKHTSQVHQWGWLPTPPKGTKSWVMAGYETKDAIAENFMAKAFEEIRDSEAWCSISKDMQRWVDANERYREIAKELGLETTKYGG